MSDETKGLRFDVYERIHLPDEVAAIDELEEIELVPRIQVIEQGDHAVLKGQLLLTGVYRGQNDPAVLQTLEHWIPVEITLPLNRISRLDDISVDIDNFDVDLLSSRTLNITGVLSLRGILVEPLPETEEAWREEPITVVHQREITSEESYNPQFRQPEQGQPYFTGEAGHLQDLTQVEDEASEQWIEEADEPEAAVTISASPRDSGWSASQWFEGNVSKDIEAESPLQVQDEREITYATQQANENSWLTSAQQYIEPEVQDANATAWLDAEQAIEQERVEGEWPTTEAQPEIEKQEPRVAFGSKPPEAETTPAANVGLMTLLQTSKREQAARHAAEEVAAKHAEELTKSQTSGDEIEWKNLFLGKRNDEHEFRKIRVCIVQRDETLESISVRYSMNPREILIYNGLNESAVAEGQLLYIP